MVKDAGIRVREGLSFNLVENLDFSHDLAIRPARNFDTGPLPKLRLLEVLLNEDWTEIICLQGPPKKVVIAERLLTRVYRRMEEESAKRHDIGGGSAADLIVNSRVNAYPSSGVCRQVEYDGERYDLRMIEWILTECVDLRIELETGPRECLLKKMGALPADILNKAA
jgi:hypothetical protein